MNPTFCNPQRLALHDSATCCAPGDEEDDTDEFDRDPEQVEIDREWEEQENDPYPTTNEQIGDDDQPWLPN